MNCKICSKTYNDTNLMPYSVIPVKLEFFDYTPTNYIHPSYNAARVYPIHDYYQLTKRIVYDGWIKFLIVILYFFNFFILFQVWTYLL